MIHFTNINGERLPEDVNKIANERYDAFGNSSIRTNRKNEIDIYGAFSWRSTEEGFDKWDCVHEGNYEPLREFHRNNTEKPNS